MGDDDCFNHVVKFFVVESKFVSEIVKLLNHFSVLGQSAI